MITKSTKKQSLRPFCTRLRTTLRNYPLSSLCILAILVLSLAPIGAPEVACDVPFFDKWAHFVMYGSLTFILWQERWRSRKSPACTRQQLLYGLLFPILFSGLMELAQAFLTTYRSGEWLDFLANATGVFLGCILASVCQRLRRK